MNQVLDDFCNNSGQVKAGRSLVVVLQDHDARHLRRQHSILRPDTKSKETTKTEKLNEETTKRPRGREERTEGQNDEKPNRQMDEWTKQLRDETTKGRIDNRTNQQKDESIKGRIAKTTKTRYRREEESNE